MGGGRGGGRGGGMGGGRGECDYGVAVFSFLLLIQLFNCGNNL